MPVFNFMLDLLWTDRCSSACSVALLGFCELNWFEKLGCRA